VVALVIAHRTCPRDAPENSREGIARAAAFGSDVVEVDARCTRDGVPILVHDAHTLRTTGRPYLVGMMSSSTAGTLRLRGGDETLPTLADALGVLPPGLGIAIDVKDPDAGPAVVDVVRANPVDARVLLWSQHRKVVEHTARAMPEHESSLLRDTHSPDEHRRFLDDAVACGARGVSAHWNALSAGFVADADTRDLAVYSWCKRRTALADKLDLPLAGIVTDWPAEVRAALAGR
jgi:glycerophosphoryl diester phosphodiesterase